MSTRLSPRRIAVAVAAMAAATALAAPAGAAAVTQTVAPGGTISTGSEVSPSDPVQMSITAPNGGTFSIDESSSPQRPTADIAKGFAWVGPQFTVSAPVWNGSDPSSWQQGDQDLTITFLFDKSALPRPYQDYGHQGRGATSRGCMTTTRGTEGPSSQCWLVGASGGKDKSQTLANGDVEITLVSQEEPSPYNPREFGNGRATFDVGHAKWLYEWTARAAAHEKSDYGEAFGKGIWVGHFLFCSLYCTQDYDVTVSPSVARQLHLHGTKVGGGTVVNAGNIRLTKAFARAARKYHHVAVNLRGTITSDTGETVDVAGKVWLTNDSDLG
jgi:hypothetical protein